MLASFLRCFPNIDTLHIESFLAVKPTGRHNAKFWRDLHPIKCWKLHVTKMVIHEFRGDRSEFEFVNFVARTAKELHGLLVSMTAEKFVFADEMDELTTKVMALSRGAARALSRSRPYSRSPIPRTQRAGSRQSPSSSFLFFLNHCPLEAAAERIVSSMRT